MKRILLKSLDLRYFKGAKSYTLDLAGKSAEIRGDNATGKTTLQDAWTWLWTGKDSAGRAAFAVKTLGCEAADHCVEAEIDVDGEAHVLSRTFREKWAKKRGSAEAEMTGHVTEYAIDGVPIGTEKEWIARLEEIVPAKVWPLLSSPTAFPALPWQERRGILTALAGDVTQEEVVKAVPELAPLPEILGKRTPEEARKVALAKRLKLNKRIDEIPARIDELSRSLSGLADLDRQKLEARLGHLEGQIDEAKAGVDEQPKRDRAAAETERRGLVAERKRLREAELRILNARRQEAREGIQKAQRQAREAHAAAELREQQAEHSGRTLDALRKEYAAIRAAAVDPPGTCTCAACGDCHAVTPERLEDARAKANEAKAQRLGDNQRKGVGTKAEQTRLATEAAAYREEEARAQAQEAECTRLVGSLGEEVGTLEAAPHALDEQIASLTEQLAGLDATIAAAKSVDVAPLETEAKTVRASLAQLDAGQATTLRIAELEAERKRLGHELEQTERELYLLDRYTQSLAELTEAAVNDLFEIARFRLFKPQINGGLEQVCEILVDGVPYGQGLNRGAETNAGLDIVRTLSNFYGFKLPIFVDNAESTTKILATETQTIRLVVDGACPKMEVTLV